MTNYKKFFVDTAPFIYFIEGNYNNPQYHKKIKCFLIQTWKQQAICNIRINVVRILCVPIQM